MLSSEMQAMQNDSFPRLKVLIITCNDNAEFLFMLTAFYNLCSIKLEAVWVDTFF